MSTDDFAALIYQNLYALVVCPPLVRLAVALYPRAYVAVFGPFAMHPCPRTIAASTMIRKKEGKILLWNLQTGNHHAGRAFSYYLLEGQKIYQDLLREMPEAWGTVRVFPA